MPISKMLGPIPVAKRVGRFSYAIRNIVSEARAVEALGRRVRYLNIGDPVAFGYQPPPHLIEAAERAMRDGYNGYLPSAGILEARKRLPRTTRPAASRSARIACSSPPEPGKASNWLSTPGGRGDEVLSPRRPIRSTRRSWPRSTPDRSTTHGPANEWLPDHEHLRSAGDARTKALVVIDPNNPTGAVYPGCRRGLIERRGVRSHDPPTRYTGPGV
jgi:aspartate/methionine/tyrosine aminotransferase